MPVEIPLSPSHISIDDLIQIYKAFCVAFNIEITQRDERFMSTQGLEHLRSPFGLDYRPCMGAKFFGQKIGDSTQFHGYSSPEDAEWKDKDGRFQELVLQYLSKKPEH